MTNVCIYARRRHYGEVMFATLPLDPVAGMSALARNPGWPISAATAHPGFRFAHLGYAPNAINRNAIYGTADN